MNQDDLDALDLLAIWRTQPLDAIPRDSMSRLTAALIAVGRAHDDTLEPVLMRAQARDPHAWLELADVYRTWDHKHNVTTRVWGEHVADAYASCLFCAAALRSEWGAALLVLECARRATADEAAVRWVEIQRALARIFRIESADPIVALDRLGIRAIVEAGLLGSRSTASDRTTAPEDGDGAAWLTPVLLEAPNETKDREMGAIVERYRVLTGPIDLLPAPDPADLAADLLAEFPWAAEPIEEIRTELGLMRRLAGDVFRLPPILLVGNPGVGKSTLVRRLAKLAAIPLATIHAAGSSDNRMLAGTAKGWSSANPSFPVVTIRRHMAANPILAVEDVDRAGGNARTGRLVDTLITMTDPATASAWLDECLQVHVNLSNISWILTANRLDRVDPGLRSRCRIIRFPAPRPQDFEVLLSGILRDVADKHNQLPTVLPDLPGEVVGELREGFATGRLQARQLAMLVRRALALEAEAERSMAN